jgi:hypothetical protein
MKAAVVSYCVVSLFSVAACGGKSDSTTSSIGDLTISMTPESLPTVSPDAGAAPSLPVSTLQGLARSSSVVGTGEFVEVLTEFSEFMNQRRTVVRVSLSDVALFRGDPLGSVPVVVDSTELDLLRSANRHLLFLRAIPADGSAGAAYGALFEKYGTLYTPTPGGNGLLSLRGEVAVPISPLFGLLEVDDDPANEPLESLDLSTVKKVAGDPSLGSLAGASDEPMVQPSDADQKWLVTLDAACAKALPSAFALRDLLQAVALKQAWADGQAEAARDSFDQLLVANDVLVQGASRLSIELDRQRTAALVALELASESMNGALVANGADLLAHLQAVEIHIREFQMAWIGYSVDNCKVFV